MHSGDSASAAPSASTDSGLDNRERQSLGVFVIDTSARVAAATVAAIERELADVYAELRDDAVLAVRVQLAIVATGEDVEVVQEFASPMAPASVRLVHGGRATTAAAVERAIALLEQRQHQCRELGVDTGTLWLWLIAADGEHAPCDDALARGRASLGGMLHLARIVPKAQATALSWRWQILMDVAAARSTLAAGGFTRRPSGSMRRAFARLRTCRTVYLRGLDRVAELGGVVAEGRDSVLRALGSEGSLVVKLFRDPRRVPWQRIEHLAGNMLPVPQSAGWRLAMPIDLVLDASGARIGFVMPRIDGRALLHVYCRRLRASRSATEDMRLRATLALELASAVAAVHERGDIVLGVLDELSVCVDSRHRIAITGFDHVQVQGKAGRCIPCDRVSMDHLPPEGLAAGRASVLRQPGDDVFALGVLVHALLLDGAHPFDAVVAAPGHSLRRLERQRMANRAETHAGLRLPPGIGTGVNGPWLADLMRSTFGASARARPTAREWRAALAEHVATLVQCRAVAEHWWRRDLPGCPWCHS